MTQTNGQKLLSLYNGNVCFAAGSTDKKKIRKQRECVEYIASRMDFDAVDVVPKSNPFLAGYRIAATEAGAKELANRWAQELVKAGLIPGVMPWLLNLIGFTSVPGWIMSLLVQLAMQWLMSRETD